MSEEISQLNIPQECVDERVAVGCPKKRLGRPLPGPCSSVLNTPAGQSRSKLLSNTWIRNEDARASRVSWILLAERRFAFQVIYLRATRTSSSTERPVWAISVRSRSTN